MIKIVLFVGLVRLAGGDILAEAGESKPSAVTQAEASRHPNILLFFPDQLRYDWTSMNPAMPDITPNLDKLAKRGAFFSMAFCPAPVCAPSRACLALGKEYNKCGVPDNRYSLHLDTTTFYKLLRDHGGYYVMGCGKFDLDKPGYSYGLDGKHGREGLPSLLDVWGFSNGIDNAGKQDGAATSKPEPYNAYLAGLGLQSKKNLPEEAYSDNWIARNGLDLIKSAPKDKPWFLFVNFNGPHPPFDPTAAMYKKWADTQFPPAIPGNRDDNRERRKYAAEIANIDHWIAIYEEELKQRGEWDNTIIAFSSDHGEMLHDHGYSGKEFPLNPSACVPLVIAGPGIQSNRNYPKPAETLDLAATFLDYAGVSVPKDMDSKSMRPFLENKAEYSRKYVTCALRGWSLVCDSRYKLIAGDLSGMVQLTDQDKSLVLYDLVNDPMETVDVSSNHPDIVNQLKPLLPPIGCAGQPLNYKKKRAMPDTAK